MTILRMLFFVYVVPLLLIAVAVVWLMLLKTLTGF